MERPKRYNVVDVLDMWEDIPDDNCDVTDESSDEDIDLSDTNYIPVDDEIEAGEPEETTTEINTPDTTKPKEKLPTKRQRISSNDKDNERTVQEKKRQKRNTNEKNNEQSVRNKWRLLRTFCRRRNPLTRFRQIMSRNYKKSCQARDKMLLCHRYQSWLKLQSVNGGILTRLRRIVQSTVQKVNR